MAQAPTIGIVISTPGRASLYRTLRSILYQGLIPGDDVLVVGDGHHAATQKLVEAFGPPFRYVATRATRDWGHSQINYGMKHVRGDIVTYQDDDDVYLPRALEEMRRLMAESPDKPLIGRVKTPYRGILWYKPGLETLLDGHCLVQPNDKKKIGYMDSGYNGDQCFISTSIANYPEINWTDRVWTLTRPEWKLFPRRVEAGSGPYHDAFLREINGRLPLNEGRLYNGDNDWTWFFYDESEPEHRPVAALKLFDEGGRTWASVAYCGGSGEKEVIDEIVEFAAWAGQGQDVWFGLRADDTELAEVLRAKGFKEHMTGTKLWDMYMEWPPNWFPSQVELEIKDPDGIHVPDWRDRFGPA